MERMVLAGIALALAAACTEREAGADASGDPTATATGSASASGSASATPGAATPASTPAPGGSATPSSGARSVAEETDDFVFNYSYPAQAGEIPELAALLDRRLLRARALLADQAARGRREARENGFPYNKYSAGMEWQVVAELPDWLSLSGELTSYTGGAHGNYGVQSLLWHKPAGEAMRGIDLFTSPRALGAALGQRYCDALAALREERMVPAVEEGAGGSVFPACPSINELTVLLGTSNGRTFDRLTLYAGPYVAGSYAEGAYAVDLAIDEAVLGVVRPEHRESFSAGA